MNDSANLNWMDNREIISSALEDEAKLKKFMSVTVVNEKYQPFKNTFSNTVSKAIDCFNKLYEFGPNSKQFEKANKEYWKLFDKYITGFWNLFERNNFISIDSLAGQNLHDEACMISYPDKWKTDSLIKSNQPYFVAFNCIEIFKSNIGLITFYQ